MDLNTAKTSTPNARVARSAFPHLFDRDPGLRLMNTPRPKPQTTYEKDNDCMDNFWL